MAIIKVQSPVAGIRGTVGGITYSANKSGPYAKAWSRGANPRTDAQTNQRRSLSTIPALWIALSGAQQSAWDTFAALPAQDRTNSLGEIFSASGYNWFTICNTRLLNIGRATIQATPAIARPASPTISSLQLPFLTGQIAKITYPSGEWTASQDQVIEIGVVNSIGRTVEPTNFLQLKLDQDPPDTDNVFRVPYLDRWNLVGSGYKGFLRAYRQTAEGIRSAPGTANFISTDSAAYAATADDYDAATNYALRGADYTSNADSKVLTVSVWFRVDGGAGTNRAIAHATGTRYELNLNTGGNIVLSFENAAGTTIFDYRSSTQFAPGASWYHVAWSINLGTARNQLYIDGFSETPIEITALANDTIDFTAGNHAFGARTGGTNLFDGCCSDYYFNNDDSMDLDDPNNLAAFISSSGEPVDLGATAAFPTGAQPIAAWLGGDPSTNIGYGGNLVNQAALSACSTAP